MTTVLMTGFEGMEKILRFLEDCTNQYMQVLKEEGMCEYKGKSDDEAVMEAFYQNRYKTDLSYLL